MNGRERLDQNVKGREKANKVREGLMLLTYC